MNVPWKPKLHFFRSTPTCMLSRPPLASSLQNLESSFLLIALQRYPHALVMCASAVESAMKAALQYPSDRFVKAEKLFAEALALQPGLAGISDKELEDFRFTRNDIVHHGFGEGDDDRTANLLLQTGFPLLRACYRGFFSFDLPDGLSVDFGQHFLIALRAYDRAKGTSGPHGTSCLAALGHLVRWSVRESLMAEWEYEASRDAQETFGQIEHCIRQKDKLELAFGAAWAFDCSVCGDYEGFVCQLDEHQLGSQVIALCQGACANCGFVVPSTAKFLLDVLCEEQIAARRPDILEAFGIKD